MTPTRKFLQRELKSLARTIISDLRKDQNERVEKEFELWKKSAGYKSMRRKAQQIDLFFNTSVGMRTTMNFEGMFKDRLKSEIILNQKRIPSVDEIYDYIVLQQVEVKDINSLRDSVKNHFKF